MRGNAGAPPVCCIHAARAQSPGPVGLVEFDDDEEGGVEDGVEGGVEGGATGAAAGAAAGAVAGAAVVAPPRGRRRRGSAGALRNVRTRSGATAAIGDTTSRGAVGAVAAVRRVTMNVRLKTMTTALTNVAVQRIIGPPRTSSG